ncbi:binary toxin-like calcium binding domain-containing protein [Salinithrix halophila]|uniref:Binary toxin-like calcium binding domain-containing protein n=1 Tax=Salinithrix halophila TaxID=1485204 RepID=A0ABV8JG30_9BACL
MKTWIARSLLWVSVLSLLAGPQMVFADTAKDNFNQFGCAQDQNKPDGDCDGDRITNDLEANGFKIVKDGDFGKKAEKWNSGDKEKRYVTNPYSKNSDGDPYSDDQEVSGKVPADVKSPGDDPMIPAYPKIEVQLKEITVTTKQTITFTEGGELAENWSDTTKDGFNFSSSPKLTNMPGDQGGLQPEFGVSFGYSKEWSKTKGGEKKNSWQTAKAKDTAKAAELKLNVQYKNTGLASAKDVSPTFNIKLGDKLLGTVKADQDRFKANQLAPNETHQVLIDSVDTRPDVKITMSLDELKKYEQGVPLVVEHTETKMKLADGKQSETKEGSDQSADWSSYLSKIRALTALLSTDTGDRPATRMYVPKDNETSKTVTVSDIISHSGLDANNANLIDHHQLNKVDTQTSLAPGSWIGLYKEIKKPKVSWVYYSKADGKLRAYFTPGTLGLSSSAIYDPDGAKVEMQQKGSFTFVSKDKVDIKALSDGKTKSFQFDFGALNENENNIAETLAPLIIIDDKQTEQETLVAAVTATPKQMSGFGTDSRNSASFSLKGITFPSGTKKLKWVVKNREAGENSPDDISFTVKKENVPNNEPTVYEPIKNNAITNDKETKDSANAAVKGEGATTDPMKLDYSNLYISNVNGTQSRFIVEVYAIHSGEAEGGDEKAELGNEKGELVAAVSAKNHEEIASGYFSLTNLPANTKRVKFVVRGRKEVLEKEVEGKKYELTFGVNEEVDVKQHVYTNVTNDSTLDLKQSFKGNLRLYIDSPTYKLRDEKDHAKFIDTKENEFKGRFTVLVYALEG